MTAPYELDTAAQPTPVRPSLTRRVARRARVLYRQSRGIPTTDQLLASGVRLGSPVNLQRHVFIDLPWAWLISIGNATTLGPGVMVLAHDASTRRALGYTKIAPVEIGDRVFIGARVVVLPGVTIGDDTIVAAGSVVSRDLPAGVVAAGVPARPLGPVDEFLGRRSDDLAGGLKLDDIRRDRQAPDWEARRALYAEAVRAAGAAWVS